MALESLSLRRFRCFAKVDLDLSPSLNVLEGKNASGKTSILEALYVLSRGRSFRTSHLDVAVQQGSDEFLVAARAISKSVPIDISLARHHGSLEAKVANSTVTGLRQMTAVFPVQLLDGQSNQLINGGPKNRRQFLDWGTFHVERGFYQTWKCYYRALRQRNNLLKANRTRAEVAVWDLELVKYGEELDEIRQRYIKHLSPRAKHFVEESLPDISVSIHYQRGWPNDVPLLDALHACGKRDWAFGLTHAGAHRADLVIRIDGKPARESVSRGQEKVLAATILLAQADLYQRESGLACTLLVDDLAAELDVEHLRRVLGRINEVGAQVVMTTIGSIPGLKENAGAVFHVKQGSCHRMI